MGNTDTLTFDDILLVRIAVIEAAQNARKEGAVWADDYKRLREKLRRMHEAMR